VGITCWLERPAGGLAYAERDVTQRTGLPAPADLLVGRDAELAAVCELLASAHARLVTLTGPPGIGKTRLAVACAAAHAARTGCEAVFVDLAPVRDPAQVIVELAQAFGVELGGRSDPIGQLILAAGSEDRLVVLDNFEHLLVAAGDLGRLLASCDRLIFLATSRERLHLSAEHEFPVPPLAMPTTGDAADLGSLAANPSVALLMDRARRLSPDFTLTAANAAALASACIRLEGLPLAIELAAARLKVLTPWELVFRLGSRMDVLAGNARDVPARQRALRNAIHWSYELLDPDEQRLFCGLSVFVGRWTLADVERVCAPATDDVLPIIESLLDKSLIRRLSADEQAAEFSMLESLREYAVEQLTADGGLEEMQARHAAHYAALALQFEASIGHPAERTWVPRVGRYAADMRTALDYCLAAGQYESALSLATTLGWYHYTGGNLGYGQEVVDSVLSSDAGRPVPARGDGDGGAAALAGALMISGILAAGRGRPDRAHDLLSRALADSEQRGDVRRSAIASAFLGHVARARGQWNESAAWHRRAAAGFEELGNAPSMAWAQHDLGLLARDRGDTAEAVTLLRSSLRDFRDLGYTWAVAWSAWGLATALAARGALDEARQLLGEALRIYYREIDDYRGVAQCLEALAGIASELAQYQTAARLIGAAAAQRVRVAAPVPEAEQERIAATELTLARSLGPEEAERFRQSGRAIPAGQAAELGLAVAAGSAPADLERARQVALTRRERQVAALVASGRTNRQIGRVLGISEKTAEVHLQHVMAKLQARSRAEVAAWAVTHQVTSPAGG
jgi:predicted ATPase/DNA-binding CsgD family transcriptional regulator